MVEEDNELGVSSSVSRGDVHEDTENLESELEHRHLHFSCTNHRLVEQTVTSWLMCMVCVADVLSRCTDLDNQLRDVS